MATLKAPAQCPMDQLLTVLMGQWTLMILWTLRQHKRIRFNALQKALPGISAKILTTRLRLLETQGVILRHVDSQSKPPQVAYELSEKGCQLIRILDQLDLMAQDWYSNPGL